MEETDQQQTPRRRQHRRRNSEAERASEAVNTDVVLTPVRRGSRRRAVTAPEASPADAVSVKEELDEVTNKSSESADLSALAGKDYLLLRLYCSLTNRHFILQAMNKRVSI